MQLSIAFCCWKRAGETIFLLCLLWSLYIPTKSVHETEKKYSSFFTVGRGQYSMLSAQRSASAGPPAQQRRPAVDAAWFCLSFAALALPAMHCAHTSRRTSQRTEKGIYPSRMRTDREIVIEHSHLLCYSAGISSISITPDNNSTARSCML